MKVTKAVIKSLTVCFILVGTGLVHAQTATTPTPTAPVAEVVKKDEVMNVKKSEVSKEKKVHKKKMHKMMKAKKIEAAAKVSK